MLFGVASRGNQRKSVRSTWLFRQVGCLVETRLSCVCHGFTLLAIQSFMGRFRRMRVLDCVAG